MTRSEIIESLCSLGKEMNNPASFQDLFGRAYTDNNWFTPEFQQESFQYWSSNLQADDLNVWLSNYDFASHPKNVGILMAGNIPLVGLHDLICTLASGHKALIKPSSEDTALMQWVISTLITINPNLEPYLTQVEKLNSVDALIATGSNNSARYFDYYFQTVPRIIRKNRNSLATLTGEESAEELTGLARDIFLYFGMGCRSVSKLMVPSGYDFKSFFEAIEPYAELIHHHKYYNNYTYHKAIFLMNLEKHFDNGFLLLKEDEKLGSPLGCLFYETYTNPDELKEKIRGKLDQTQIIVATKNLWPDAVPFGQSQSPALHEFADRVDTLAFLNRLS